ncbi:MAG: endoribonuclease YicC domain-containing protein, partial [Thermoanaerobaculia bacterium]
LEAQAEVLAARRAQVRDEFAAGLKRRLQELLVDRQIPEERLALEVALLVERSDVQEELDRLGAHLQHCRALLAQGGEVGRRLDFLAQEVQRELNTLGAKCRDVAMTEAVVEAKLLCEQLREQVQNVE